MTQDIDIVVDPAQVKLNMDAAASKLVRISKGSHKSRRDLRAIFGCDLSGARIHAAILRGCSEFGA